MKRQLIPKNIIVAQKISIIVPLGAEKPGLRSSADLDVATEYSTVWAEAATRFPPLDFE